MDDARSQRTQNIELIKHVAKKLGSLRDEVVFVGGAVAELLITDPAAPAIRATDDVDIIIEVSSLQDYYGFGDSLKELGFKMDLSSETALICRWIIDGIRVDFMPTNSNLLGFSNAYYEAALKTSIRADIGNGLIINVVSAPCFLATKLEAFNDRGKGDFLGSADMEDIISVLDGRPEIVSEISVSPLMIREFLSKSFKELLKKRDFVNSLAGHLAFDTESPDRTPIVLERIRNIAGEN